MQGLRDRGVGQALRQGFHHLVFAGVSWVSGSAWLVRTSNWCTTSGSTSVPYVPDKIIAL
ncbi:hypothetical protein [Nonomuraea sp. NPDC049784]|uniref:hypothetical protein n=1 Tax=Nonomuraea sp. NPDC049784 TaxID=3154361 RepID=UPI0033EBEA26